MEEGSREKKGKGRLFRMSFVRLHKVGNNYYQSLVENYREGGKVKQRYLAYIGSPVKNPVMRSKNPEPSKVLSLADWLNSELRKLGGRVVIAGGIRRNKKDPHDIDIVMNPRDKEAVKDFIRQNGKLLKAGDERLEALIKGVKVDIFFADDKNFGSMLYYATGPGTANIGRRTYAKNKGLLLNQDGVFDRKTGKYIAGRTEYDVFKALGRPYKKPEERG